MNQVPITRKSILIGVCISLLFLFGVCWAASSIIRVNVSDSAINITSVALTTDIRSDGSPVDNVSEFAEDQSKIFCVVDVSAVKPVTLTAKWYFGDTLVREDQSSVAQRGIFYIQPINGKSFSPGEYRVEIYLYNFNESTKTVHFSVK